MKAKFAALVALMLAAPACADTFEADFTGTVGKGSFYNLMPGSPRAAPGAPFIANILFNDTPGAPPSLGDVQRVHMYIHGSVWESNGALPSDSTFNFNWQTGELT